MRIFAVIIVVAVIAVVGWYIWWAELAPPDGHTEFQVQSVTSDRQGLSTDHYVLTTDGRILRFDRQRVDWVAARPECSYSAGEYLHINSVPVITDVKLLGCIG